MAIIELRHTKTGEVKTFEGVEKQYILRVARLINIEEAEELLIDEYDLCGDKIRYDLCINLETGKIEVRRLYGDMVVGFNNNIAILSLDVRRGGLEFFSWIEDEDLEHLEHYLDTIYV